MPNALDEVGQPLAMPKCGNLVPCFGHLTS